MDVKQEVETVMATDGSGGTWTDEEHTSFLNRMEGSFVRRMLFGDGRGDDGSGRTWTDQKHTSFLNWMEASFVRQMRSGDREDDRLDEGDRSTSLGLQRRAFPPRSQHPRLDRYLPDGADSTLDARVPRSSSGRRTTTTRSHRDRGIAQSNSRTRQRWSRRYTEPHDRDNQVVPELGSIKADE